MTDQQRTFFDDEVSRDLTAKRSGAPFVTGSDTSRAAAESLDDGTLSQMKADILRYVDRHNGATCDEIEEVFGLRHQTASARMRDLEKALRIQKSSQRRKTRSGRKAVVYVVRQQESR